MKVSSIKYLPYSATVLLAKAGHPDLCGVIKSACSPNLYNCIHNLYVWDSVIRFFKIPDDSCDHSKLRSTVQKWAIKETSHPSLHQKLLKAGPVLLHYTIGLFQYVWRGNCEMKKKKKVWRIVDSLILDKILGLFFSPMSQARSAPAGIGGRLQRETTAFLVVQVICLPLRRRGEHWHQSQLAGTHPASLAMWGHGVIRQ